MLENFFIPAICFVAGLILVKNFSPHTVQGSNSQRVISQIFSFVGVLGIIGGVFLFIDAIGVAFLPNTAKNQAYLILSVLSSLVALYGSWRILRVFKIDDLGEKIDYLAISVAWIAMGCIGMTVGVILALP